MFCKNCGKELGEGTQYCPVCGQAQDQPPQNVQEKEPEHTKTETEEVSTPTGKRDPVTGRSYELCSSKWMTWGKFFNRVRRTVTVTEEQLIVQYSESEQEAIPVETITQIDCSFYIAPIALAAAILCSLLCALGAELRFEGIVLVLVLILILGVLFLLGKNTRLLIVDQTGKKTKLYSTDKKQIAALVSDTAAQKKFRGNLGKRVNVLQVVCYVLILILFLIGAAKALTGSGSTAQKSVTEAGVSQEKQTTDTKKNSETAAVDTGTDAEADTPDLQKTLDEAAAVLDGTCWMGMDTESYTCYLLAFSGNEVVFCSDVEGDEAVRGYWTIGADTLNFYKDTEYKDTIGSVTWSYDNTNEVMMLHDTIVMAQVDGNIDTAAQEIEKYSVATSVAEYLDKTIWAGTNEEQNAAMAFTLGDGEYYMGIINQDGTTEEHEGTWTMDYDNIYLYDAEGAYLDSLSWNMEQDGSLLYFVVQSTKTTFVLAPTDVDNLEDALTAMLQ